MARMIVAGPPCSGKTTFVRENMKRGDVVYDYDTLHQALSGQAAYDHEERIRPYAQAARDAIIAKLASDTEQPAWVITATAKSAKIRDLQKRLNADVVLCAVDREEAHRRCDADNRPKAWHEYIDRWFGETDIDPNEWGKKARRTKEGRTMKYKTFTGRTEFKADDDTGYVKAVFATLNCIDHDGDVTLPGAFTDGEKVRIAAWGHNWGTLPPGVGAIHEADGEAYMEGFFNLKTQAGRDHYETVKQLGDLQEWSYGYDIIDAAPGQFDGQDVQFLRKLKVHEVSPVMLGAGINTRTEMLKEGRRNSTSDLEHIQGAHDHMAALGAICAADDGKARQSAETTAEIGNHSEKVAGKGRDAGDVALLAHVALALAMNKCERETA